MKNIGNKIKIIRTVNHETQEVFANKLGVTRQSVSHWENNKVLPSTDILFELCSIYDVSIEFFLNDQYSIASNEQYRRERNYDIYFSLLPFTGVIVSFFSICLLVMKGRTGDVYDVIYTLIPAVTTLLITSVVKRIRKNVSINWGYLIYSYLFLLTMEILFAFL